MHTLKLTCTPNKQIGKQVQRSWIVLSNMLIKQVHNHQIDGPLYRLHGPEQIQHADLNPLSHFYNPNHVGVFTRNPPSLCIDMKQHRVRNKVPITAWKHEKSDKPCKGIITILKASMDMQCNKFVPDAQALT